MHEEKGEGEISPLARLPTVRAGGSKGVILPDIEHTGDDKLAGWPWSTLARELSF